MTGLTTITWKSITVLPPLIGISVLGALIVALVQGLSLHLGVGLFVCALAFAEIGYLAILILVNRRDVARSVSTARNR